MKEKPIIFSAESIQDILKGCKTQTRRVIRSKWSRCLDLEDPEELQKALELCPYGQPGNQLWVRETWMYLGVRYVSVGDPEDGDVDAEVEEMDSIPKTQPLTGGLAYRADDPEACRWWFSPIFMPRWASRINLEILKIRAEKLQDISEEDCCRETGAPLKWPGPGPEPYHRDMQGAFAALWNSINAKNGFPWESNPWVWVIEFKKIERIE